MSDHILSKGENIIINGVKVEVGQIWEDSYGGMEKRLVKIIAFKPKEKDHRIVGMYENGDIDCWEETISGQTFKLHIPNGNNHQSDFVKQVKTLKTIVYWWRHKSTNEDFSTEHSEYNLDDYKLIAKREIELTEGEGL